MQYKEQSSYALRLTAIRYKLVSKWHVANTMSNLVCLPVSYRDMHRYIVTGSVT